MNTIFQEKTRALHRLCSFSQRKSYRECLLSSKNDKDQLYYKDLFIDLNSQIKSTPFLQQIMTKSLFQIVFALGGPGSGKGTQCALIANKFNFIHLSAGQLLRKQQSQPESQYKKIIEDIIKQGKIVPSHITVNLLLKSIRNNAQKSKNFLIDGFPRNIQNYNSWKQQTKSIVNCPFVLHLKCSEVQMTKRLLKRGQKSNRSDDNMGVIRKRFVTYNTDTMSVVQQFRRQGRLKQVDGDGSCQQVWRQIQPIFNQYINDQIKS